MRAFSEHLAGHYVPNSVIVDATASEAPAAAYLDWMQRGLHIITPNKKLNSGPLQRYLALRQFQRESYIHFFYEVRKTTRRQTRTAGTFHPLCIPLNTLVREVGALCSPAVLSDPRCSRGGSRAAGDEEPIFTVCPSCVR